MINYNLYVPYDKTTKELTGEIIILKNDNIAKRRFDQVKSKMKENGLNPDDYTVINLGVLNIEVEIDRDGKAFPLYDWTDTHDPKTREVKRTYHKIMEITQPYDIYNVPTDIEPKETINSNDQAGEML